VSRSIDQALAELLALLPDGWAWDRTATGGMAALLRPVAERHAAVEAGAEALLVEVDPGAAEALLPDYERVLGPDPCGRDLLLTRVADRQAAARQRWTASGQPTPAFFVQLAADLGLPASVEEFDPPVCGPAECGEECSQPEQVFVWRFSVPPDRLIDAECGVSECGDLLGDYEAPLIECVISAWAPAHTTPVFDYSGSP
jgi:uncharacterized protein YmfQ (DUF2313 family)